MRLFGRRRRRVEEIAADEDEEIAYEPVSVRELLTEMKDVSELMVDLAYSAVIFDSEEIAEEVQHLEDRMDRLNYQIRLQAMVASRTVEDAQQLTAVLQVAQAAENIANAAGDIADLLESRLEVRPFVPKLFAEADEKSFRFTVPEASPAHEQTIGGLRVESETGQRIIALRRGKRWIYGPEDTQSLAAGDILIVRGPADGAEHFKEFLAGREAAL